MTGASRQSPLTVSAVREIPHPPELVYAFVAQMDNHWHLSDRRLRLKGLNDDRRGGRIVIAGPLGLRRTAHTTVTTEHEPHQLGGLAAFGGGRYALTPAGSQVYGPTSSTAGGSGY